MHPLKNLGRNLSPFLALVASGSRQHFFSISFLPFSSNELLPCMSLLGLLRRTTLIQCDLILTNYICKDRLPKKDSVRRFQVNVSFKWTLFNLVGFPGGSVVKNSPTSAGDTRDMTSVPRLRRPAGEGLLQWRTHSSIPA